jgi:CheY-like chemotaxis protein
MIFSVFEQADGSLTRKQSGAGLGLPISERIVEMMGGKIWVESEIGKGALFSFTIHVNRGENKQRAHPGQFDWKNLRILAVDDEAYILKDFKGIIESFGASCDGADNAGQALSLIRQNGGYNIYFIDWKMPEMDGIELTRELRKIPHIPGDPLVVMISYAEISAISVEAKKAGVDKFLQKPLFPSSIEDIIGEYLGISAQEAPKITKDNLEIFEGRRILIAEDVEINREIVFALLEQSKLKMDFAVNGAEAVRMFAEEPEKYEMIFMDVQMPEMDGYEATRQIRALDYPAAKTVPIVAMTANVFVEDIENCLRSGMDGHVGKPLDLDALFEQLHKYLTF